MTSQPATPAPDTRDWTWVLAKACTQCGYDAPGVELADWGTQVRNNAAEWRTALNRGDIVSQRPPAPEGKDIQWSALEYGAHVRDVFATFNGRIKLLLAEDHPTFADWDQDQAALAGRYWEQEVSKVSYDLARFAGDIADTLDRIHGDQWERTGLRSNGSQFTVATLGLYMLHDPIHHLWDVAEGFGAITG